MRLLYRLWKPNRQEGEEWDGRRDSYRCAAVPAAPSPSTPRRYRPAFPAFRLMWRQFTYSSPARWERASNNQFRNADRLLMGGDMAGYNRFDVGRFQRIRHSFSPLRWSDQDESPGYSCLYCHAELFEGEFRLYIRCACNCVVTAVALVVGDTTTGEQVRVRNSQSAVRGNYDLCCLQGQVLLQPVRVQEGRLRELVSANFQCRPESMTYSWALRRYPRVINSAITIASQVEVRRRPMPRQAGISSVRHQHAGCACDGPLAVS